LSGALQIRLALGALGLCAGCTLLDLSSRINQDSCKYDAECEILNDGSDPNFDPCKWFACGPEGKCVPGLPDLDHDGYISRICPVDAAHQDCDDADELRYPGAVEVCDDRDNDCDVLVDEGVLAQTQALALDFSRAQPASDFAYALDTAPGKLTVGTLLATSPQSLAVNVFAYAQSSTQLPLDLDFSLDMQALQPEAVGVAQLMPIATTVVGAYSPLAPARIVVGVVDEDTRSLRVDSRVAEFGLHCAENEACAARGMDPQTAPPAPTPWSDAPTISPGTDGTLVAYVRNDDRGSDLCTPGEGPVSGKPLLANLLTRTADGLGELTHAAVPIGVSVEGGAPAVLALPSLTTNGASFGWLVAYPVEGGDLVISDLRFRYDALQANQALLRVSGKHGALHAPHLALGRMSTGTPQEMLIGLVAQRGCGDASRVVFALLLATLNPDASVKLHAQSEFIELGGAERQRAAALSYRSDTRGQRGDRRSWGVSYRDASGVRVRLVSESGVATGAAPYLLMSPAADSGTPAEATSIAPLQTDLNWFAVYAYGQTDSQPSAALMRSALVSCGSP
jgi:hypothetical protein